MVKHIKHLLKNIFGNEKDFTFEQRLVLSYSLYAGLVSFLSIFINIGLGLGIADVILVLVSSVFLFTIYVLGRFYKKNSLARLLLSVFALLFCNFYWLMNYGSRGSAMYMFIVHFFIMIFIWGNFQIRLIVLIVFINIMALMALEISYPELIPQYPTEDARIIDSYVTVVIVLCFFALIIVNVKNNYIKQYKMAQRSDKLKSAFLANMSHEIRTPLNAIIGFSQLLFEKELPKDKKVKYSKLITENSDYLMKLISDILDISMIESGHLKIIKNRTNLNSLFNHTYSIHNEIIGKIKNEDVKLILDIPSVPTFIEIDEMRLKQVIFNLIGNSIKFTSKGHIRLGFKRNDRDVVFFVEDTGTGIKDEFKDEVFDRFVRNEDSTTVRTSRGSGIGLSLSKELVNILGGEIWFTSKYLQGTTFYVSLPAVIL